MAAMKQAPRHFSMLRTFHAADWFTIANGFCGVSAIFEAMRFLSTQQRWHLYLAAALVPVALVFDVLDGRIARWRHAASLMGRELDSLADVISFGVAPACLAYSLGFTGLWDALVLLYFVVCGISRLARYNVTAEQMSQGAGKVTYFEGTPIPSSVLLVGVLMLLVRLDKVGAHIPGGVLSLGPYDLRPFVLLFALSGSLMISKTIHIPKP